MRCEGGSDRPLEHLTDLGNARRLVSVYGHRLRHVTEWGAWLVWDGMRHARDRDGRVDRMAKDISRIMHDESFGLPDRDEARALSKHAFRSENEARIKAMVSLARTEMDISVLPERLDADPWAFNVSNGTIDLRTGELHPHNQADLITKLASVEYAPEARAEVFEAFLLEIMDGRVDLVRFIQRAVGYSMTGHVSEHVLLFLYGLGANGKSTLFNVLLRLFGDYAKQSEPELLMRKRGESHPTGIADLKGARLVVTSEIDAGRRMAESLVKQLTGGDRIKARYMRQDFFEFEPSHTLWLMANHKPVVTGTDAAIWRRILLVPFDVTIPSERQDSQLGARLEAELPGILNWAVRGCLEWQHEGLAPPEEVRAATRSYRTDMDTLGDFLAEHCVIEPRAESGAKELYDRYTEWTALSGERKKSKKVFGLELKERGFETQKDSKTRRLTYLGIGLLASSEALRSSLQVPSIEISHVERNDHTASDCFADPPDHGSGPDPLALLAEASP